MKRIYSCLSQILAITVFGCVALNAVADDEAGAPSMIEALLDGKPYVNLRYRYEFVDDDLVPTEDAHASTLRAALGWRTGVWNGFSAYAEMEHISEVLLDDYKEGPGPVDPGGAGYPVVADPPGTELNQAYLSYRHGDLWGLKIGRQDITYRKAPLHRFIGNVLWRQNWQTHDGATIWAKPQKDLLLNYAYSAQVNRIFGDDAPDPFDDFNCACHLINIQYSGLKLLKLEGYAYLLDIDNAPANSVDTVGIRGSGAYPLTERVKLVYAGEYASQEDADGNPRSVDADYLLAEGGFAFTFSDALIKSLLVKVDYELLEGDGIAGFQTPLSTAHAFQGWADRFLTTPADGIADLYVTAIAGGVFGGKVFISYHMMESDNLSYDYGNELNIQYTRKFAKYWTFGTKAAFYDADRGATALARAGGLQNNDVTKVWAWLQFVY